MVEKENIKNISNKHCFRSFKAGVTYNRTKEDQAAFNIWENAKKDGHKQYYGIFNEDDEEMRQEYLFRINTEERKFSLIVGQMGVYIPMVGTIEKINGSESNLQLNFSFMADLERLGDQENSFIKPQENLEAIIDIKDGSFLYEDTKMREVK